MTDIHQKNGERLLAESEHYYIVSRYEEVYLYSKADGSVIARVGDHYGDPESALIDRGERFCVSVGCGYIVYYIREPFLPYEYGKETAQWSEAGRGPDDILWIESVRQTGCDEIGLTFEDGHTETVSVE